MKALLKSITWILFALFSCEQEDDIKFHLDSINSNIYYSEEVIPLEYQNIYGKWKLYEVSGGFSGIGHEPDFDYMEIKSRGIYGLIKNDTLFEYGKIERDSFGNNNDFLQVKLIPDYHRESNPYMTPPEKYLDLKAVDSLNLISPCCDMYNYHFKRIN